MAPARQARAHSRHSEQPPQARQRSASATAASSLSVKFDLGEAGARAPATAALGISHTRPAGAPPFIEARRHLRSAQLGTRREHGLCGTHVPAGEIGVDGVGGAVAGGDRLDDAAGALHGVAAGEDARHAGRQRLGIGGDQPARADAPPPLPCSSVEVRREAGGEDDRVAGQHVLGARRSLQRQARRRPRSA